MSSRNPHYLLENIKRYAARINVTITDLIEAHLRRVPRTQKTLDNAPIVRRLTGTLSQNITVRDCKKHLEDKYGI